VNDEVGFSHSQTRVGSASVSAAVLAADVPAPEKIFKYYVNGYPYGSAFMYFDSSIFHELL